MSSSETNSPAGGTQQRAHAHRSPEDATADANRPIVFFDGVCGLCSRSVNWLLARDPHHRLRFAPLQGTTATAFVPVALRRELSSLVLAHDGQTFMRTAAVSRILTILGGRFAVLGWLLWLIPWPLRDIGYRCVAKIRYRVFGKLDACRMPTPDERAVFLP